MRFLLLLLALVSAKLTTGSPGRSPSSKDSFSDGLRAFLRSNSPGPASHRASHNQIDSHTPDDAFADVTSHDRSNPPIYGASSMPVTGSSFPNMDPCQTSSYTHIPFSPLYDQGSLPYQTAHLDNSDQPHHQDLQHFPHTFADLTQSPEGSYDSWNEPHTEAQQTSRAIANYGARVSGESPSSLPHSSLHHYSMSIPLTQAGHAALFRQYLGFPPGAAINSALHGEGASSSSLPQTDQQNPETACTPLTASIIRESRSSSSSSVPPSGSIPSQSQYTNMEHRRQEARRLDPFYYHGWTQDMPDHKVQTIIARIRSLWAHHLMSPRENQDAMYSVNQYLYDHPRIVVQLREGNDAAFIQVAQACGPLAQDDPDSEDLPTEMRTLMGPMLLEATYRHVDTQLGLSEDADRGRYRTMLNRYIETNPHVAPELKRGDVEVINEFISEIRSMQKAVRDAAGRRSGTRRRRRDSDHQE